MYFVIIFFIILKLFSPFVPCVLQGKQIKKIYDDFLLLYILCGWLISKPKYRKLKHLKQDRLNWKRKWYSKDVELKESQQNLVW